MVNAYILFLVYLNLLKIYNILRDDTAFTCVLA